MSVSHVMQVSAIECALNDLAEAATLCVDNPTACGCICTAVANLIAGAGPFGGTQQAAMMQRVEVAGFTPEFYGCSIRVHYLPAKGAKA